MSKNIQLRLDLEDKISKNTQEISVLKAAVNILEKEKASAANKAKLEAQISEKNEVITGLTNQNVKFGEYLKKPELANISQVEIDAYKASLKANDVLGKPRSPLKKLLDITNVVKAPGSWMSSKANSAPDLNKDLEAAALLGGTTSKRPSSTKF